MLVKTQNIYRRYLQCRVRRSAREIIERRIMIEKTDAYRTKSHADRDCQHGFDAADALTTVVLAISTLPPSLALYAEKRGIIGIMNLTPIEPDILPLALKALQTSWASFRGSSGIRRVAAVADELEVQQDTPDHRRAARALVDRAGMAAIDAVPATAFSWDGRAVRTRSEASVLIHEVAHWLIAPPDRRALPDFGLGAGPETGRIAEANAARCVDDAVREKEELLASLLGILFEAALGQPAIHAFIEQNWLEAWDRPAAADQFGMAAQALADRGLIDGDGLPVLLQDGKAATAAISIRNSGQASADTSTMAEAGPSLGK